MTQLKKSKNNGYKTQKISAKDGYITIKDMSIDCYQVAKFLQKELGSCIYNVQYAMDILEELFCIYAKKTPNFEAYFKIMV